MEYTTHTPFDSIESAQEYLKLLEEAILEATEMIESDIVAQREHACRRTTDAMRLASYNLSKLAHHVSVSCRILNDLRMLRRILVEQETNICNTHRV